MAGDSDDAPPGQGPDLRGLFRVLDTRPIPGSGEGAPPSPPPRAPQAAAEPPAAPTVPAGDARLLAWLKRAEADVPRVRELLAGGQKRPDLRRRGVALANELLVELGEAIGFAGGPHKIVTALAQLGQSRALELAHMLYRASMERL